MRMSLLSHNNNEVIDFERWEGKNEGDKYSERI